MKYILEKFKKYLDENGIDKIIDYSKLPEGDYFKINENGEILEHFNYKNGKKNKTDEIAFSEEIRYFKERWFYDRRLTSNKSIEIKKKFEGVTPYLIAINKDNIKEMDKYINSYLTNLNEKYNADIDIEYFEELYLKKVMPKILDKISMDKIFIVLDIDIEFQKRVYYRYLDESLFLNKEVDVNGELKGTPIIAYTLNQDKPNILSTHYRKSNYLITLEEAYLLTYITKIDNKILEKVLSENDNNISLKYNQKDNKMSEYKNKRVCKRSVLFKEYSVFNRELPNEHTIDSFKNKEEILSIVNRLTDFNICKVLECDSINDLKINNNLLHFIAINRDILREYFIYGREIDISKIIEKAYMIKILELETDNSNKLNLKLILDNMISTINCLDLKSKRRYQNINMDVKNYIDKINKIDKDTKEYLIEDEKEFLFLSGQVLRYLANMTESKENKLKDVANLKTVYSMKKKMITKCQTYSYKGFSRKFEILYRAILNYEGEVNIANNYFYYHGGLIGTNYLYKSVNKEADINE